MSTKAELEEQVRKLERKVARLEKSQEKTDDSDSSELQATKLEAATAEGEDLLGRIAAYGAYEEVILPPAHTGPVLVKDLDEDRLSVRAQNEAEG